MSYCTIRRQLFLVLCLAACAPPAPTPVYKGVANDGDGPAKDYPPGMKAEDGATKASSRKATANSVGGAVEAVPTANAAQAKSENTLVSNTAVAADGASFPITIVANGLLIKGDKNSIRLVAELKVFDNAMKPIKDKADQPSQTVIMLIEGPGLTITMDGTARGETPPKVNGGAFTYEFKAGQPWQVKQGKNNVQLDLRIEANARDGRAKGDFSASFAVK